jgi:hypothetical protein
MLKKLGAIMTLFCFDRARQCYAHYELYAPTITNCTGQCVLTIHEATNNINARKSSMTYQAYAVI